MAVIFSVRLTPRGGRDGVESVGPDGVLRVRVAAPPVDGAANDALVHLLAADLAIPRSAVTIVGGASSRSKRVAVEGPTPGDLRARWPGLAARV